MQRRITQGLSLIFLILSAIIASPTAKAARAESFNQIWFNSNGDVVGQHAEYCNNVQLEGGLQTGAFSLIVHGGCGDFVSTCGYNDSVLEPMWVCQGAGTNNAITASTTGNTGTLAIHEVCDLVNACWSVEPELMVGHGFNLVQIYP